MISTVRRVPFILAAIVAILAVADYLTWRASHHRLFALAEESGLTRRSPEITRDLERETVPARAATHLAGSLLSLESDRGWLAELPAAERAEESRRGLDRLRLASRLAEEVLPRCPASWRAATILGFTRFLAASRQGRWDQPASTWRGPLRAAMQLAPTQPEPALLLAGAELSRWSALSQAEREQVLPVLERALEQKLGAELLLPSWVRMAPSLDTLLEPIPERIQAWERLCREFLRIGDLERYAVARRRWWELLPEALAERVANAQARLRGGAEESVLDYSNPVLAAPHDLSVAASFSAALAILTDQPAGGRIDAHLRRWLAWALDLCVLERCPLSAETLGRLAARLPALTRAEIALAAIAAEDPAGARRYEPAAGAGGDPEWNRYWIFKATRLAASDPQEARRSLARASRPAADRLRYWRAAESVARASGNDRALGEAGDELAQLARSSWSADQWTARDRVLRLELLAAAPASGVRLTLAGVPAGGAAIELRWDGRTVGVAAFPADGAQRWLFAVEPGAHLVEIESLTGRPPRPLVLSLAPAPAD